MRDQSGGILNQTKAESISDQDPVLAVVPLSTANNVARPLGLLLPGRTGYV